MNNSIVSRFDPEIKQDQRIFKAVREGEVNPEPESDCNNQSLDWAERVKYFQGFMYPVVLTDKPSVKTYCYDYGY